MIEKRGPMQNQHSYNEQIRSEAMEWLIRFCEHEVDRSSQAAFSAWLRASPEHVRAYLEISALWQAAGSLRRHRGLEAESLIDRARRESSVVALSRNRAAARRPGSGGIHRLFAPLAASVVAAALLAGSLWWRMAYYPTYATHAGERRTITLADGSAVQLDALSRVEVRYRSGTRTIELQKGQAFFTVVHDAARPFFVIAGGTRVRDVGTVFDVSRWSRETVVTVVEGRVSVSTREAEQAGNAIAPESRAHLILLAAGEQVAVTPGSVPMPRHIDVADATAWTEGRLVFDSTPMSKAVEEFDRYMSRPIWIDDPQIDSYHVTGSFATTDSAGLVRFLTQRFGLAVHEREDGTHLARQKP